MTDEKKYELIERYLAEELSEAERADFENQLKVNADLREEVSLHQQVTETLRGEKVHELRDVIKEVDEKWASNKPKENAKVVSFPFRKIAALAAAVLALVLAYQFLSPKNTSSEALFADNFEPYKMILNQRSLIPNPETEWMASEVKKAVAAYQAKDYAEASTLFQALSKETPDADAFQIYAANSELSLGHSDEAIVILNKLVEKAPPLLIEQSRWYLALAHLQKEDYASAKSQLQQIQSDGFKYKEAQKILRDIQ